MEFFRKIKFLTENTINYDVTFGVILSTVARVNWELILGKNLIVQPLNLLAYVRQSTIKV